MSEDQAGVLEAVRKPGAELVGDFPLALVECAIGFAEVPPGHVEGGQAWQVVGWLVHQDGKRAVLAGRRCLSTGDGRARYSEFCFVQPVRRVVRLAETEAN